MKKKYVSEDDAERTRGKARDAEESADSEDGSDDGDEDEENSVYDSEDGFDGSSVSVVDSEDGFEDQGSSDEDEELLEKQEHEEEDSDGEIEQVRDLEKSYERTRRKRSTTKKRQVTGDGKSSDEGTAQAVPTNDGKSGNALVLHTDDLSSDDEDAEGEGNRIGRVPLHWYDEYDHQGYNAHGNKVMKSVSADGTDKIDAAIASADNRENGKFVVHDALNDKNVELSARQLEIIRRVQGGAFAHPEFEANPDYIDYYSGVDRQISGLNSNRTEPKSRFKPSKWEDLQVKSLLAKLRKGKINMDYLKGNIRDMNDLSKRKKADNDKPFMIWTGAEEDELNLRKGPQYIAAPKPPPPGHAESYVPPDEYLPTEEEKKEWEQLDASERPHGLLIPKKHPNLRSVGAYEHSVREVFERCLDLYLCPRVMKRKLNIDPESLVPKLPRASDLRPFPTSRCIEYKTPYADDEEPPIIRCVTCSPDGQYMVSGASDGYVRLWEVSTSRLLRSWNAHAISRAVDPSSHTTLASDDSDTGDKIKPVVAVEWNTNSSLHCVLVSLGKCAIIIATGTEGLGDVELTDALLAAAKKGGAVKNAKASKAVTWHPLGGDKNPMSAYASTSGPVAVLVTKFEMASVRWHSKGDYFVTVCPKAGASSVLVHQLSKGNSQQPFSKAKGEVQLACFHPNKPFLFVASQKHVRIYNLVKQMMVKRLISGCRWISSLDIHPSGDHVIIGSLDKRVIWFDLDLSNTPYKTLKYHERAVRGGRFHPKYPLMASASDDGTIHVFHSMVYSDLLRNPLIVPVKILRGHTQRRKFGVLAVTFHPRQPWLFSGGADGKIFLYQDI